MVGAGIQATANRWRFSCQGLCISRFKVLMAVVVTAGVSCALLAIAQPSTAGCGASCKERVARKQCSQTNTDPCLVRAALHWRIDVGFFKRLAYCEGASSHNPYTINGAPNNPAPLLTDKSKGLVQFMQGTYDSTPYRNKRVKVRGHWWSGVWSAKWNALAGAWLIKHGGTGPWTASRGCWG